MCSSDLVRVFFGFWFWSWWLQIHALRFGGGPALGVQAAFWVFALAALPCRCLRHLRHLLTLDGIDHRVKHVSAEITFVLLHAHVAELDRWINPDLVANGTRTVAE